MINKTALFTLAFGVFCAPTLQATSNDAAPWYQVNIIIFERIYPTENEYWPKDQIITYPKKIAFLESPSSFTQQQNNTAIYDTQQNNSINPDTDFKPEQPFVLLDDQKGLQDTAKRLRNARNYRVLFHESWRQPLQSLSKSPAIVIKGGDTFDDKHALNGTITLGIGRYLHAKAHLWLTEFEANFGQEAGAWPALPRPPTPQSTLTEDTSSDDLQNADFTQSIDSNTIKQTRFDQTNIDLNLGGSFNTRPFKKDDIDLSEGTFGHPQTIDNILNERYVIKNITVLNQTRRMRSNEIHYIDHPKFGIIVNMTSYEPPAKPVIETESTDEKDKAKAIEITIPTPQLGF